MQPQYADYYGGRPARPTYKAPPLTYDSRGPNAGYRDYIQSSYQDMMGSGGYNADRMRAISQRAANVYGGMQGRQTERMQPYRPFTPGIDPSTMDWMNRFGRRRRIGLKSKAHGEYMLDNPEPLDLTFGGIPQYGAQPPQQQFSGSLPSYGWQPRTTY